MRVLIAGALANKPGYGGEAWVRIAWVRGLRMLGADVLFVEELSRPREHPATPSSLEQATELEFFRTACALGGLEGRASLIRPDGRWLAGLPTEEVLDFAQDADLLVNISGHLTCASIFQGPRVRAYVDLDPGFTQFWYAADEPGLRLEEHDIHFTVGENVGTALCPIPTAPFRWLPIRQPVLLDEWPVHAPPRELRFTTVASWRGAYGPVSFQGSSYGLKVHEFRKFAALPRSLPGRAEIALDIHPADVADRRLLESHGWSLVDPSAVASTPTDFRDYLRSSSAELTVAQGVYVDTRCGWFSDRSARYLASGRPVIVQDTGFQRTLPVGEGLLGFRTPKEAADAAHSVAADYDRHARAARALAESHFSAPVVLKPFLEAALAVSGRPRRASHSWRRRSIVVSGMVAGVPYQGGASWAVLQYVLGLRRMGHRILLVEEVDPEQLLPGGVPLAESENGRYFLEIVRRYGLEEHAALVLRGTGETVGLARSAVAHRIEEADLLLNLSGSLRDPEMVEPIHTRAYVDLDPAFTQLWHEVHDVDLGFESHTHFVTVGLALGSETCPIPTLDKRWIKTLPPVLLEHWPVGNGVRRDAWTSVGHWRGYGGIEWDGEHYGQRAHAFRDLFPLPVRTGDRFEIALAIHREETRDLEALAEYGWHLVDPGAVASTPDAYRDFVQGSLAEMGIAKSGYVRSRCGWFSDRSACYLAAGRPVVAQDTGFSRFLPSDAGLIAFETLDEAAEAVRQVRTEYGRHARAARRIAEAHFDSEVVLGRLLEELEP